jgi:hypothetical protein
MLPANLRQGEPWPTRAVLLQTRQAGSDMTDDTEIARHREQIVQNRTILEELEAGNTAGGDVFPETQSEIEHLKAQIAQSELIVAASEKASQ